MATPKENSTVKVFARFRPLNTREKTLQTDSDIKFDFSADHKGVRMTYNQATHNSAALKEMDFACDRIFDQNATQEQVFDEVAREMVEEVIKGYNATIFAYGQTGSGKTHCMFGPGKEKHQLGLIPRSADYLFEVLEKDPEISEATIKIGLLEIYREDVKDLFVPSDAKLQIRETPSGMSYVAGLHEEFVASAAELMALLAVGSENRSTAATKMNDTSSRSHCVLIITVTTKTKDGTVRVGKMNMADLAGSEKVKSTGATGQTLKEAQMINQSLSCLGNCINALTDAKRSHVPYRDSRLTFLLKDSLGGNTKTALMVACSPAAINGEETYGTLKFAQRAKLVQNVVCVNAEMSVAQLTEMIEAVRKQIEDVKRANPDKTLDALEAMLKERDQLSAQLRVCIDTRQKIEAEFKYFREHMVRNWTAGPEGAVGRRVSKPSVEDYANNPFGAPEELAAPAPSSASASASASGSVASASASASSGSASPDAKTASYEAKGSHSETKAGSFDSSASSSSRASPPSAPSSSSHAPPPPASPSLPVAAPVPRPPPPTNPTNLSTAMPVPKPGSPAPAPTTGSPARKAAAAPPPQPKEEAKGRKEEKKGHESESDSEADDEKESRAHWQHIRICETDSKETRVHKLHMENARLEIEVSRLKEQLTETHKKLILKNAGTAGGVRIIKPLGGHRAVKAAKQAIHSVVPTDGEHIVGEEVAAHTADKIVHFSVKSCCCSLDTANASLVGIGNFLLQPFQKVLKTGQIQKMRHHWIELTLAAGYVLIQKHPNGCISVDFVANATAMRDMALEAAGMSQSDTPAGQEDVKVEEEDSDPGLRTVEEVTKFVQAQPAKYRSLDLNSKSFALAVAKWYKTRTAEAKAI